MKALILAGGAGTRLWPASRKRRPKQLLTFLNDKTLLQNTYERLRGGFRPSEIYIATTSVYVAAVRNQLPKVPKVNYSLESVLRDRGPAIGLAALLIAHRRPNTIFATAWSDHHIAPQKKYLALLKRAEAYLTSHPETILQVGVSAQFSHSGLGYILPGRPLANRQKLKLFQVKSFKEKPGANLAARLISRGALWNTGIFIWNTSTLLELYRQHLPKVHAILMKIQPHLGSSGQQAAINRFYPKMPTVDIEHSLIEKLGTRLAVVKAGFSWADIGSWKIIKDALSAPHANLTKGRHALKNTTASLLYNYSPKQLLAVAGLENIGVVVTPEVVLVINLNDSEQVKELRNQLAKDPKLRRYL